MDQRAYLEVIHEHMKHSYLLDDEKIGAVLPGFLSTLKEHLQILEQRLATEELTALGTAGHTMKGALLNLGLFELAEVAYTIEIQGKAQKDDADYSTLVSQLKKEVLLITGND